MPGPNLVEGIPFDCDIIHDSYILYVLFLVFIFEFYMSYCKWKWERSCETILCNARS